MNNAVQLWDGHLSVITRPVPHVQNSLDVVVKITYSGISGTDLKILEGKFPCEKSVILGHEFVGVVKEAGKEVKHVSVGDRVVINPNTSCGMCDNCAKGTPHFCKVEGVKSTVGIKRNGGWAQYCRLPAKNVIPLPHQLSFELGLLLEPMSCVIHGWNLLQPISPDSEILLCGAGSMGLLFMCLLHFRGYREVIVSELLKGRQRIAQKLDFGFQVVHPEVLVSEGRNAVNDGDEAWGFDIVIDCTGDAKTLEQGMKWLRPGGKFLLFGISPSGSEAKIDPHEICLKELKIIASRINPYTFTSAMQILQDMGPKYLSFEKLGMRTFHLQEFTAALEIQRSGEISKAVFEN
ncbi:uncharacterized protein [Montipora capricornis]|uniref:uncharacterized protein n=1 Tax=Montipora foliosa TaxID=591990 RepID=UPI0035F21384